LRFGFCNFLDVNLQDFVWKFFAEELFLIPENGTYGFVSPARIETCENIVRAGLAVFGGCAGRPGLG
jgi:hypothetical protein